MKKQWISIKCGLSRDPKHRRKMAKSIWLFMHMLDIADWETGMIYEWKDEAAAEQLEMQVRTLREQRRELDEQGYITCVQKQYGQDITIHNWTNPREYTGEIYNKKQGGKKASPEKSAQDDIQGDIQGNRKDVTPTLDSNNQIINTIHSSSMQQIENEANRKVDAIIDFARQEHEFKQAGKTWRGREFLPTAYIPYGDWWHTKTGQHMYAAKGKAKIDAGWIKAFGALSDDDIEISVCDAAYQQEKWRTLTTPMQIVLTAKALKAAPKAQEQQRQDNGKGFYA